MDQTAGKAGLGDPEDPASPTSPEPRSRRSPERSNEHAPNEPSQQEPPQHDRTTHTPEPEPAEARGRGRKSTDPSGPSTHTETEADRPGTPGTDAGSADVSVEQLTAGLLRLHAERMQVVAREQDTRVRFTTLHPEVPVAEVAALPGDVHDLSGLRAIGELLATGSSTTRAGAA